MIAVVVGLVVGSAALAVMGFVIGGIVATVFALARGGDWLRDASGGRFDRPGRSPTSLGMLHPPAND